MLSCVKLPLTFDPRGLEHDLSQVSSGEWVRHFNDRYYEGEWSGVALRAVPGASTQLVSQILARLSSHTPNLSRRALDLPVQKSG